MRVGCVKKVRGQENIEMKKGTSFFFSLQSHNSMNLFISFLQEVGGQILVRRVGRERAKVPVVCSVLGKEIRNRRVLQERG